MHAPRQLWQARDGHRRIIAASSSAGSSWLQIAAASHARDGQRPGPLQGQGPAAAPSRQGGASKVPDWNLIWKYNNKFQVLYN